jgi:hypothetical protein
MSRTILRGGHTGQPHGDQLLGQGQWPEGGWQKPKDGQGKQGSGGKPPQKATVNAVTQQVAAG